MMNRIKVEKNKDYTIISNVFLRDKSLSLKAKGVLAMVMAMKDDWDFSINGFCKITKEGEAAIYTAIKELKDNGYCKECKIRDENKRIIGNEYTFYETPQTKVAENQLNCGNLNLGSLNQGNQGQLNTNNNKINIEINKKEDIKISSKKEKDILSDYDTTDVPEGFLPIIKIWCEYKRDKKQKYKSQKSFQTMVNHLHKLSKGNPHDAKLIVEQSIGNNYAGLFELSNKLSTNNLPLGFKLEDDRNEVMKNQPKQSW